MSPLPSDTAQLLSRVRDGDREAFDCLFTDVYDDLRRIAHWRLRQNRPGQTLTTTALVHEAYLRLVDQPRIDSSDRAHFLALASRAIRFLLINQAEARGAQKRGAGVAALPLHEVQVSAGDAPPVDLLALHQALDRLSQYDERLGRMIEYRFFGGLTYEEIAEVTGMSTPTVKRDWARAQGWLYRFLQLEQQDG